MHPLHDYVAKQLADKIKSRRVLAEQIHVASGRKGAFVAINCAGIPATLIESELFGHVRGAFTGAGGERSGAFVAADGGTLFLDEIGDAPLSVQLSLLRALETGRIKPVGSDRERAVDVRVVAATSRDIDSLIALERFRGDFYHRIAQFPVRVPALRDRPADVIRLAEMFLAQAAPGLTLPEEARAALTAHAWPGNVRELKNAVDRAAALAPSSGRIDVGDLVAGQVSRDEQHATPVRCGFQDRGRACTISSQRREALVAAVLAPRSTYERHVRTHRLALFATHPRQP